ncbi:MAG: hypothetical protein KJ731_08875 [Alphaproteobacteria bacterium]|nr:hypothetical protein [Alphaproteobacteria bacterium]MBU1278997.1 hypothetical protein [Alphaproteobacteria bacterium]MBU1573062.1 hypothetical protein [Alphaproteobacteria bacterium]MBU1828575.1 hypothetical protein [Alphaproteobacteria bacterium]MBU2080046.1 hypothetical protein [Alphaproteobacteria bacterium]
MTAHELDEIMTLHWPAVLRGAMRGGDEWMQGFTRSIARHAKRASWRPSLKQEQIMRRLVSELHTAPDNDAEVIER